MLMILFLFNIDSSEWSIAHRLAVYLENEFPEWNVDCEYNRQGLDGDSKENSLGEKVRPDIVVHHRGCVEPKHNLLIIELKKNESNLDFGKACEYTKPPKGKRKFQYQFGFTLSVINGPTLNWFTDGEIMGLTNSCS